MARGKRLSVKDRDRIGAALRPVAEELARDLDISLATVMRVARGAVLPPLDVKSRQIRIFL